MIELSPSYQHARHLFLDVSKRTGCRIESHLLPDYHGVNGELLYCDVAYRGRLDSHKCLVISSGLHGVEGYCGSAIQTRLLSQHVFERFEDEYCIMLVHALNPYGFSHSKRVNENNVDMNRNFQHFNQAIPFDQNLIEVNENVFPKIWQGSDLTAVHNAIKHYISLHSLSALQEVLTAGQYYYPDSVFYGGRQPQWTRNLWDEICQGLAKKFDTVAHIDIHTGLGESGDCELMYLGGDQEANRRLACDWFGESAVTIPGVAASTSKPIIGHMGQHLDHYPVRNIAMALEFGTQPIERVLTALINDAWLQANPECDNVLRQHIVKTMREAFMTQGEQWGSSVWSHSLKYVEQTMQGLKQV